VQSLARAAWVEKRTSEVLATHYFHVVFTIPEQIASIAYQNKDLVYGILFRATAETLSTIAPILNIWGRDRLFRRTSQLGTEPAFTILIFIVSSRRRDFT